MTSFEQTAPESLRVSLRERFADRSPAPDVSPAELADLIMHALNEAFAAIDRVAMRAPTRDAQLAVYTIAIAEAARGFKVLNEKTVATLLVSLGKPLSQGAMS